MSDDAVAELIAGLERPVEPPREFADRLLASLVEPHVDRSRRRRDAATRLLRPGVLVPIASAAALIAAYIAFGPGRAERVATRPAAPSVTVTTYNGVELGTDQSQQSSDTTASIDSAPTAPLPGAAAPPQSSTVSSGDTDANLRRERRLAYATGGIDSGGNAYDNVFILNLDTGQTRQVTSGANDVAPSWSPDGRRLLFYRVNVGATMMVDDDGTHVSQVVDGAYAVWSPDGNHIAYVAPSTRSCTTVAHRCTDVWVMALDSGERHVVGTGGSPAWSPDGSHLVVADGDGTCATDSVSPGCDGTLYTVDINGQGRTSLGLTGWAPQFSPDGSRIAYETAASTDKTGGDADSDVHVANSDGSGDHVVLGGPEGDNEPIWSGYGYALLYHVSHEVVADQGIYSCDENGAFRQPVVGGAYPAIGWALLPD